MPELAQIVPHDFVPLPNSDRGLVTARTPLANAAEMDAVQAVAIAFPAWRETPPVGRTLAMFKFKQLLEDDFGEIARVVASEHGKTFDESCGSCVGASSVWRSRGGGVTASFTI